MIKILTAEASKYVGEVVSRRICFRGFPLVEEGTKLTADLSTRIASISPEVPTFFIYDPKRVDKAKPLMAKILDELYSNVRRVMGNYSFDSTEDVDLVSEIMESIISSLLKDNCYLEFDFDTMLANHPDFYSHSLNTAILSSLLAIKSGRFQHWLIEQITLGALLHDIGILKLERVEGCSWRDIPLKRRRDHTVEGYALLEGNNYIADSVKKIVLMHHFWEHPEESFDATTNTYASFPSEYKGRKIPYFSKTLSVSIVQAVSSFELMTGPQALNPISKKKAIQTILSKTKLIYGEGAILLSNYLSPYSIGEKVLLNNGKEATVLRHTSIPGKPIVLYYNGDEVDLSKKELIHIVDKEE